MIEKLGGYVFGLFNTTRVVVLGGHLLASKGASWTLIVNLSVIWRLEKGGMRNGITYVFDTV